MRLLFISICVLSLACSIFSTELTSEQLSSLKDLDAKRLPEIFQARAGDNSHWCCNNDKPINTVQRTKTEKEIHIVATKVKTGYTSCGFLGTMRCSLYSTRYKQVIVYHTATYEVPDESGCPDHQVKCCKDYINVAGNCLSLQAVMENAALFQQLLEAGLISKP